MSAPRYVDGATVYTREALRSPSVWVGCGEPVVVAEAYPDNGYETFYAVRTASGSRAYAYESQLGAERV